MRARPLAALLSLLVFVVVAGCGKSESPPPAPVREPARDAGRVDPFRPPEMMLPPTPDAGPKLDAAAPTGPVTDADEEEDLPPDRPAVPPVVRTPNVYWKPTPGTTWDWQLKVPIDPTLNVEVYDI